MRIRMTVLALASALVLVAGAAAPAGAGTPLDVSNDTISCDTFLGTMKFLPSMITGGSSVETMAVKGTVEGCTPGTAATTVVSGSVSGTLTATNNDCVGLNGLTSGTSGNLLIKWKTLAGAPKIAPTTSTMHVNQLWWGPPRATFKTGIIYNTQAPTVTGAFTGGFNGMQSHFEVTSAEGPAAIAFACLHTGLKGLTFGIADLTLG